MKNIYQKLEQNMVKYQDLITVPIIENDESFVLVDRNVIPNKYLPKMSDMEKIIGKKIIVRKFVYEMLKTAQQILQKESPRLSLFLTYGYRSLSIQTTKFLERLRDCSTTFIQDPVDLYEEIHRSIAVPMVAGHPTGGAIDITIINTKTNKFLDFGTKQYDYTTKDFYVFSPNISNKAKDNRILLRSLMMRVGFAPFDGEWWHFSYGDREWAHYYKKKNAIYIQKVLDELK